MASNRVDRVHRVLAFSNPSENTTTIWSSGVPSPARRRSTEVTRSPRASSSGVAPRGWYLSRVRSGTWLIGAASCTTSNGFWLSNWTRVMVQSPVSAFWVARNELKPPTTSSTSPCIDPDRSIRNDTCTGVSPSGSLPGYGLVVPGLGLVTSGAAWLIRSATPTAASRPSTWVRWPGQAAVPFRAPRQVPAIAAMVSVSPPALTALNRPSTGVLAVAAHHSAAGTASMATGPVPSMLSAASGLWASMAGRIRIRSMTVAPSMSP